MSVARLSKSPRLLGSSPQRDHALLLNAENNQCLRVPLGSEGVLYRQLPSRNIPLKKKSPILAMCRSGPDLSCRHFDHRYSLWC